MGNEIQFGIYKFILVFLFLFTVDFVLSQDYIIDLKGDTQQIAITDWFFNQFYVQQDEKTEAIFCDDLSKVYRSESELTYLPYSFVVEELDYVDFLIPSIPSLRSLSTDYFQDEHWEIWMSGAYTILKTKNPDYNRENEIAASYSSLSNPENYQEKYLNHRLFWNKDENKLPEIPSGVIFIHHDSLGFAKIVADELEQDYYELLFSRYSYNPSLNDSIFSGDFKLKQKNFLEDFDDHVSPLTEIQFKDKDLAAYNIVMLREGALILLLNLELRKIKLYRDAGNNKLANELEAKLLKENQSYCLGFIEPEIFNFCKVYVTDAKNRDEILAGQRTNIFLDANLQIDSTIILTEDFFLFARKGQVFETQAIDQNNMRKKAVTSTPVVQNALVIYDHNNTQLMAPFPFYVREGSAFFTFKNSGKKAPKIDESASKVDISDYKELSAYLIKKYGVRDFEKSYLAVASTMNVNFYKFHEANIRFSNGLFQNLKWNNRKIYENGRWIASPSDNMNISRNSKQGNQN